MNGRSIGIVLQILILLISEFVFPNWQCEVTGFDSFDSNECRESLIPVHYVESKGIANKENHLLRFDVVYSADSSSSYFSETRSK